MTDLALKQPQSIEIKSIDDLNKIASLFAASGFFKDANEAPQAAIKILAGQELGFPSFASMTGIHIIQGKPTMGANLMAAAIKRSGRYNYRVLQHDATVCEIEFYERFGSKMESVGESKLTLADAKERGLTQEWDRDKRQFKEKHNWKTFPENMLFARAISNGMRWYCPDLLLGAPVYTPEELGAQVDENGDVIDVTPTPAPPTPAKPPKPAKPQESEARAWLKSYAPCIKEIGFADASSKDDFIAFLRWATGFDIQAIDDIPSGQFGVLHQIFKDCDNAKSYVARWRTETTPSPTPQERITSALHFAGFQEADFETIARKVTQDDTLTLSAATDEHVTKIERAVDTVDAGMANWLSFGVEAVITPV